VAALDAVVAGDVARVHAMERALHGGGGRWQIRAGGFLVPVERIIDEESMRVVFHGMMIAACDIRGADLLHEDELISRQDCRITGPCVLRWEFLAAQSADRAA
jgi:hypothetical protein